MLFGLMKLLLYYYNDVEDTESGVLQVKHLFEAVRERQKEYSEFMFWGCFTYDKKGPCHIWTPETKQEKEEAQKAIESMNKDLEPILKEEWEL